MSRPGCMVHPDDPAGTGGRAGLCRGPRRQPDFDLRQHPGVKEAQVWQLVLCRQARIFTLKSTAEAGRSPGAIRPGPPGESRTIEAFGSSEPVGTGRGRVKHILELSRVCLTGGLDDGIGFFDLSGFNVVVVKPDRKIIYSRLRGGPASPRLTAWGCGWWNQSPSPLPSGWSCDERAQLRPWTAGDAPQICRVAAQVLPAIRPDGRRPRAPLAVASQLCGGLPLPRGGERPQLTHPPRCWSVSPWRSWPSMPSSLREGGEGRQRILDRGGGKMTGLERAPRPRTKAAGLTPPHRENPPAAVMPDPLAVAQMPNLPKRGTCCRLETGGDGGLPLPPLGG